MPYVRLKYIAKNLAYRPTCAFPNVAYCCYSSEKN